ncbi:MAG: adenylosuccinate lyase, partial [Verrucomicrobiales bacterium]
LKGYLAMASGLAGDQWNEGDVSCSVVRRVMLPDAFFSIDGLLETFITVLGQLEAFPAVISKELEHYLPFLSSTTFLMEAVKAGAGREEAHEAIKEHSVAAVLALRNGESSGNDLLERLAADARLGISLEDLQRHLAAAGEKTGAAVHQVDAFSAEVRRAIEDFPEAENYRPGSIL